jgi:hypothetical protein
VSASLRSQLSKSPKSSPRLFGLIAAPRSTVTGMAASGHASIRKHGVNYEASEKTKSDFYRDLLPLINSGAVDLLEHDRLVTQLTSFERRTARGGKNLRADFL